MTDNDDEFAPPIPIYPELEILDENLPNASLGLADLLQEIDITDRELIIQRLQEKRVDASLLPRLHSVDIRDLFPVEVGLRVRLRTVVEKLQAKASTIKAGPSATPVASVVATVATNKLQNNLPLEDILRKTKVGQDLLKQAGSKIQPHVREHLIEQIARYFLDTGIRMAASHARFYSADIQRIFPYEDKTYYCMGRAKAKGGLRSKLYNKYRNMLQKTKNISTPRSTPTVDDDDDEMEEDEQLDCEEQKRLQSLLMREKDDWALIMKNWKATCSIRKNDYTRDTIKDIVSQWPLVKHSLAPKLLDVDFEFIHKDKSHCLYMKWNTFVPKITKIYQQRIKDSDCKKKLDELKMIDQTTHTNKRDYLILCILHGLLKPSVVGISGDSSHKKTFKPSIGLSQKSQFYIMNDSVSITHELEERRNDALKYSLKVCPFVIIDESNERYFVYLEDVYFTFSNFLAAYDCCFKLFQIFNFTYPKESQQVWLFIQRYFYEITTKNDDKIENIIGLISDLNAE